MTRNRESCRPGIRRDKKAASPAVSMVIITAATVVLVVIASSYALQVLTRQQAEAELDTVQNSILAFDDALRDIAWDPEGSRSILFRTQYGNMLLMEDKSYTISSSGLSDTFSYNFDTATIKYQMPYGYGVPDTGSSYILGDGNTVVHRLSESLGQVFVEYESGATSITLNYRVRVSEQGQTVVGQTTYNYVDIFVIKLNCNNGAISGSNFNLICKNVGLKTISAADYSQQSSTVYTITDETSARISVLDNAHPSDGDYIDLVQDMNLKLGDNVIFNLIVADVRVGT